MEARLSGSKMAATRSGFVPIYTTSCYGVAVASHVAMFSKFDGICVSDNLRLRPSAGNGGLIIMM